MLGHPDIVPGQHDNGEREHRGVEHFLPGAGERLGDQAGEQGDDTGTENTGRDAAKHIAQPMRHRLGHGEDDADDKPGFDNFTKDDDEGSDHNVPLSAISGVAREGRNAGL